MIEFVNKLFVEFAWETGILGQIREYEELKILILTILGVLTCFLGFKIFRGLFSILTFMATALVCIYLMKDKTDWGTIVTTFSVIGIALAFFAFRWTYLGAIVINCFITVGFITIITNNIVASIISCIFISISTILFPVISTTILTSAFGGLILGEIFTLHKLTIVALMIFGSIIQKLTNKNQQVFEKEYPDKVIYFLENREKVKQYARSTEERN